MRQTILPIRDSIYDGTVWLPLAPGLEAEPLYHELETVPILLTDNTWDDQDLLGALVVDCMEFEMIYTVEQLANIMAQKYRELFVDMEGTEIVDAIGDVLPGRVDSGDIESKTIHVGKHERKLYRRPKPVVRTRMRSG